jgi:hypothetical protein
MQRRDELFNLTLALVPGRVKQVLMILIGQRTSQQSHRGEGN